jgi:hypothetical protein
LPVCFWRKRLHTQQGRVHSRRLVSIVCSRAPGTRAPAQNKGPRRQHQKAAVPRPPMGGGRGVPIVCLFLVEEALYTVRARAQPPPSFHCLQQGPRHEGPGSKQGTQKAAPKSRRSSPPPPHILYVRRAQYGHGGAWRGRALVLWCCAALMLGTQGARWPDGPVHGTSAGFVVLCPDLIGRVGS